MVVRFVIKIKKTLYAGLGPLLDMELSFLV